MSKVEENDLVVLKSVYGNKVGQKYTLEPCIDPKTHRFPPHVKSVDSKGDMILTESERNSGEIFIPENWSITFESGKTFNLNDPREKAEWQAIQFAPIIAHSIDARDEKGNLVLSRQSGKKYSACELYIEKPEYETNKKITQTKLKHDAETYVFEDAEGADGRLKIARLLGRDLRNAPDADVMDYLLDIANRNPEKLIKLYTGNDLSLRIVIQDARDKHVIVSKNNVFFYQDTALGGTIDSVVIYLQDIKHNGLLTLIKRDTYAEEMAITNPRALKSQESK